MNDIELKKKRIQYITGRVSIKHPSNPPEALQMIESIDFKEWMVEIYRDMVLFKNGIKQGHIPLWYIRIENKNFISDSICVGVPDSIGIETWFNANKNKSSVIARALESDEIFTELVKFVPEIKIKKDEFDLAQKEQMELYDSAPLNITPGVILKRSKSL